MAENDGPPKDRATALAEERTDLALTRTRLAADRTLDAWVRTALAMISFGFTIFKFLHDIEKQSGASLTHPHAARRFGLSLVIMGTLAVIGAIYQHLKMLKELGLHPFQRPISLAVIVAVFIALLGLVTTLSLATNIGPF